MLQVDYFSLPVKDLEAQSEFYSNLGASTRMSKGGYLVVELGQSKVCFTPEELLTDYLGIAKSNAADANIAAFSSHYDSKEELVACFEKALASGAKGLKTPHSTSYGTSMASFEDPAGYVWELVFRVQDK